MCNKGCDICEKDQTVPLVNVTEDAKRLVRLLTAIEKEVTLIMLAKIYLGSKAQGIYEFSGLDGYGAGAAHLGSDNVERILRQMIAKSVLCEKHVRNCAGFVSSYVRVGSKVSDLLNGRLLLEIAQNEPRAAKRSKPSSTKRKYTESTHQRVRSS